MRILFYILFLAFTLWLGFFLEQNPSSLQITFRDQLIEMPLWIPVVSIFLVVFALSLIFSLLATIVKGYRKFKEWLSGSTAQAIAKNANNGFAAFVAGDWSHAENYLVKAAKHSDIPVHYYLTAARAAQELGAIDRRDNYLHSADKADPEYKLAVAITQAELEIKQEQLDKSLATLQDAQKIAPHNIVVLKLLARVYSYKADWQELIKLLPLVKKYQALPGAEINSLEAKAYSNLLSMEAKRSGRAGLQVYWDALHKNTRQQPEIITQYVQLLLKLGADDEAEHVLRNALKKQWDLELVKLYGLAVTDDLSRQIATAETWLRSHPDQPILLLTLARLCLANKLWGKARSYLEAALELQPSADAYAELGRLLSFLGEQQKALDCYKTGLLEFAAVLPFEVTQK
jgi:HemY protein